MTSGSQDLSLEVGIDPVVIVSYRYHDNPYPQQLFEALSIQVVEFNHDKNI